MVTYLPISPSLQKKKIIKINKVFNTSTAINRTTNKVRRKVKKSHKFYESLSKWLSLSVFHRLFTRHFITFFFSYLYFLLRRLPKFVLYILNTLKLSTNWFRTWLSREEREHTHSPNIDIQLIFSSTTLHKGIPVKRTNDIIQNQIDTDVFSKYEIPCTSNIFK